jgi:hypothetical protein|tara:strand:- start:493 stop:801 length:309 start_codon:yes stop_codon:yes gene_type:complete
VNVKEKKGLQSKLGAMRYYADNGYHVYNETNNTGPVDFIAINPDTKDVKLVEVKTMSFRSKDCNWRPGTMINRQLSSIQKQLGVELVYYNINTGQVKCRKKV